jgi:hypothetical protein
MSRKNEPKKIKMSVRDNRLFMSISGQKKLEEQEQERNDLEGARRKTPTKRSSSAIKRDKGGEGFYSEELRKLKKGKEKIKKMMKKKNDAGMGCWMNNGPIRGMFKFSSWTKYSPYIAKIQNYDNFDAPEVPPLQRLYRGQEHRDRKLCCSVCEKIIDSTENMFDLSKNIYCHLECSKIFTPIVNEE